MAEDVRCEVENCKFYEDGDICTASAIKVVSHDGVEAADTKETDCSTFEKRD